MTIAFKATKKPVTIDAILFDGSPESFVNCLNFIQCNDIEEISASWTVNKKVIFISTLEGIMEASVGDYIIKGVNGEFYPCKPDIFKKTYDF